MKKHLSSLAALFVFGLFAATSGAFDDGHTLAPLEMSPEEKQRRQDECVTLWEHCEDWCWKSNKKGEELRACLEECKRKLADCMAKID